MNKFGVSLISILATLGLTAGGVAVYNHLPNVKDKLTISVGESVLVGENSNIKPTETVNINTEDLNKFCRENQCMMILAINLNDTNNSDGFSSQLIRVNSAEEVKTALDNTYYEENALNDESIDWKGWALSKDGEIIEDFSSIYEESFVTIYAITESYPVYALQILGSPVENDNGGYYHRADKDGKISNLPDDPEDQAPEGYTFAGWSTSSETGIDDIVDLSTVTVPYSNVTIYYAVYVNDDGEAYDRYYYNRFAVYFTIKTENGQSVNYVNYSHYEFEEEVVDPQLSGYTFIGWYREPMIFDGIDDTLLVTDLSTLKLTGQCEFWAVYQDGDGNYYTPDMISDLL